MDRKKKLKAAIAGVMCYIKEEQERKVVVEAPPVNYPSIWALQSRQTIMQNRALLQRRVLKR